MARNKVLSLAAILLFFFFFACSTASAAETGADSELVSRTARLVLQVSIILFAAWAGGALFNKFGLPSVLGEVLSGVIIGPYLLGSITLPTFPSGVFPLYEGFPVSPELYALSVIASILLLFLVGVETDVDLLFRFSVAGLVVGIGGVVVSFVAGAGLGLFFVRQFYGGTISFTHPIPLFLGVVSTATSVGITARILSNRKKLDSPEGVTIISAAVIDDVLGIIAFAVVIGIIRSGHVVWHDVSLVSLKAISIWLFFTIAGLALSRHLSRFLKSFEDRPMIAVMSFALALLLAGIFEKSGLAMIIGAYVMGISLSRTDIKFVIQENLSALYRYFIPLFFCVMGMLININELLRPEIILFGLIYSALAVASKFVGCALPALFMNFNFRGAARIGVGMVPRGEVALIISGIGLAMGVVPHDVFSLAVGMTFITTLITPPMLDVMLKSDKPVLRKEEGMKREIKIIKYALPNSETTELILEKVINAMESEGFFVHCVDLSENLYQIRKNDMFLSLRRNPEELVFECSDSDAPFVNTVFYEIIAEIEELMKRLETVADKRKIGKHIFDDVSSNGKEHMKILQIIKPGAVTIDLKGTTKEEIISELVDLLIKSGQLPRGKREEVLSDIMERERTMSTGMQEGIAMPHVKTLAVDHLVSGIGIKKIGIDFDSLDKKPSNIFIITLAPKNNQNPYLQFMGDITRVLIKADSREKMLSASSDAELYTCFSSLSAS